MTPLLPPIAGNLLGRFRIRKGTAADIATCDRIARQYKNELGFVRRDSLTKSASKGLLHVAEMDGIVRGFVEYNQPTRGTNKGYSVVYHLATERGWSGYGIGRNLLYSVPTPIRLKCTVDNTTANAFYAGAGMRLVATEQGKKRALNLWELHITFVFVMGNNATIPDIARQSGMAYGSREIETPASWAYQVDIDLEKAKYNWRKYEWGRYLRKIKRWKPFAALVVDYFEPDQKPTMLQQIQDLRDCGVERILVCPKFNGAVKDIPQDCIIAVSVPSSYAGFLPDIRELEGRKIHLLGGSPTKWFGQRGAKKTHNRTGLIAAYSGGSARVISIDGNTQQNGSQYGAWWDAGKWIRPNTLNKRFWHGDMQTTMIESGRNIVRMLNYIDEGQLPLWAA